MSSNPGPVLLPLTEFLTQQITTLYQSNVQKTIVNNLNNFVSADAAITINGRSSCLDGLASQIQSQTAGEAEATVTVAGVVEAPSAPDTAATAGTVGIFATVTIDSRIRVQGAAAKLRTVTLSAIAKIQEDTSIPIPATGPNNRRRVTNFHIVFNVQQTPL